MKISCNKLRFQYVSERFHREVYGGSDEDMMMIHNSPHYSFLKKYIEVGNAICNMETNIHKMNRLWGRDDKFIAKKVNKLIRLYEDIKRNGLKEKVEVVKKNGYYEIYDGHHRAAICAFLGYETIPCKIRRILNDNKKKS